MKSVLFASVAVVNLACFGSSNGYGSTQVSDFQDQEPTQVQNRPTSIQDLPSEVLGLVIMKFNPKSIDAMRAVDDQSLNAMDKDLPLEALWLIEQQCTLKNITAMRAVNKRFLKAIDTEVLPRMGKFKLRGYQNDGIKILELTGGEGAIRNKKVSISGTLEEFSKLSKEHQKMFYPVMRKDKLKSKMTTESWNRISPDLQNDLKEYVVEYTVHENELINMHEIPQLFPNLTVLKFCTNNLSTERPKSFKHLPSVNFESHVNLTEAAQVLGKSLTIKPLASLNLS